MNLHNNIKNIINENIKYGYSKMNAIIDIYFLLDNINFLPFPTEEKLMEKAEELYDRYKMEV